MIAKYIFQVITYLSISICFAQSTWGELKVISEDSYCFKLLPPNNDQPLSVESLLGRFKELPIDKDSTKEVFRIASISGALGDGQNISILRLERIGSTCSATIKLIDNPRTKIVFVHTKNYDIGVWEKFKQLTDTTFWNQPDKLSFSGSVMDGQTILYEFNLLGKYHSITRGSNFKEGKERLLFESAYKLLEPIFGIKCKDAMR